MKYMKDMCDGNNMKYMKDMCDGMEKVNMKIPFDWLKIGVGRNDVANLLCMEQGDESDSRKDNADEKMKQMKGRRQKISRDVTENKKAEAKEKLENCDPKEEKEKRRKKKSSEQPLDEVIKKVRKEVSRKSPSANKGENDATARSDSPGIDLSVFQPRGKRKCVIRNESRRHRTDWWSLEVDEEDVKDEEEEVVEEFEEEVEDVDYEEDTTRKDADIPKKRRKAQVEKKKNGQEVVPKRCFVFSTGMANRAGHAVSKGLFSSITAYHQAQTWNTPYLSAEVHCRRFIPDIEDGEHKGYVEKTIERKPDLKQDKPRHEKTSPYDKPISPYEGQLPPFNKPIGRCEKPVALQEKPGTPYGKSVAQFGKPVSQSPSTPQNEKPLTPEKPVTEFEKPGTQYEKPSAQYEKPVTPSKVPANQCNKSPIRSQQPVTSYQKPVTPHQKPMTPHQKPSPHQKPTAKHQKLVVAPEITVSQCEKPIIQYENLLNHYKKAAIKHEIPVSECSIPIPKSDTGVSKLEASDDKLQKPALPVESTLMDFGKPTNPYDMSPTYGRPTKMSALGDDEKCNTSKLNGESTPEERTLCIDKWQKEQVIKSAQEKNRQCTTNLSIHELNPLHPRYNLLNKGSPSQVHELKVTPELKCQPERKSPIQRIPTPEGKRTPERNLSPVTKPSLEEVKPTPGTLEIPKESNLSLQTVPTFTESNVKEEPAKEESVKEEIDVCNDGDTESKPAVLTSEDASRKKDISSPPQLVPTVSKSPKSEPSSPVNPRLQQPSPPIPLPATCKTISYPADITNVKEQLRYQSPKDFSKDKYDEKPDVKCFTSRPSVLNMSSAVPESENVRSSIDVAEKALKESRSIPFKPSSGPILPRDIHHSAFMSRHSSYLQPPPTVFNGRMPSSSIFSSRIHSLGTFSPTTHTQSPFRAPCSSERQNAHMTLNQHVPPHYRHALKSPPDGFRDVDKFVDKCKTFTSICSPHPHHMAFSERPSPGSDRHMPLNDRHPVLKDRHLMNDRHPSLSDRHLSLNDRHSVISDRPASLSERLSSSINDRPIQLSDKLSLKDRPQPSLSASLVERTLKERPILKDIPSPSALHSMNHRKDKLNPFSVETLTAAQEKNFKKHDEEPQMDRTKDRHYDMISRSMPDRVERIASIPERITSMPERTTSMSDRIHIPNGLHFHNGLKRTLDEHLSNHIMEQAQRDKKYLDQIHDERFLAEKERYMCEKERFVHHPRLPFPGHSPMRMPGSYIPRSLPNGSVHNDLLPTTSMHPGYPHIHRMHPFSSTQHR